MGEVGVLAFYTRQIFSTVHMYIFYSYSNYVFPVFLGGFLDKFHVFNLLKIRFSLKKGGVDLKIKPGEGGPLI